MIPAIRLKWRSFTRRLGMCLAGAILLLSSAVRAVERPNIILIFTDDQGYGDLSCYGSERIQTPHIDQLASRGRKFMNCMVPSPVCTPSRAGLLTGCYPKRVGLEKGVLFPQSKKGLHPDEHTIADQLKTLGYATGCFGKWHLGHLPEVLPMANGFDTYFGIPFSNDMNDSKFPKKPRVSSNELWKDQETTLSLWKTPLVEGNVVTELPVDQRTITRRYTQKAIDFIKKHKGQPFFIYLPHSMPHIPLYVPEDVYDPDPQNAYQCTIEHIDEEVGRLMQTVRDEGLESNTYVIYTSDNGPWLKYKNHGGSAGELRGGKSETWEGGQRVPCVVAGPGVPANTVCDDLISTIDFLPTIASFTGSKLPADRMIDGVDISEALYGTAQSPRSEFLYYTKRGQIDGIRQDQWKLLVHETDIWLFDLIKDQSESNNLAKKHPEVVLSLQERMQTLDQEIAVNARPAWEMSSKRK